MEKEIIINDKRGDLMRILLVEDEYEKVGYIHSLVGSLTDQVDRITIKTVRSANDAKFEIQSTQYEVMIIDLHIPDIEGGDVSFTGGQDLLSFIETDVSCKIPSFILGLSSHQESIDRSKANFKQHGWLIYHLGNDLDILNSVLTNRILSYSKNIHTLKVDVAIVTALPEEQKEVLNKNCNWETITIDDFEYFVGHYKCENGSSLKLLSACSEKMGVTAASTLTTRVAMLFSPKLIIMVGICAGVKGKTKLGDIIIGDPVWDWGAGKIVLTEDGQVFQPEPHHLPLDRNIKRHALALSKESDDIFSATNLLKKGRTVITPEVHILPMACGSQVIADETVVGGIAKTHRKLAAIEMESYGVVFSATSFNIKSAVIKSVCDFADSEKGDDMHEYAASASAIFAFKLIERVCG